MSLWSNFCSSPWSQTSARIQGKAEPPVLGIKPGRLRRASGVGGNPVVILGQSSLLPWGSGLNHSSVSSWTPREAGGVFSGACHRKGWVFMDWEDHRGAARDGGPRGPHRRSCTEGDPLAELEGSLALGSYPPLSCCGWAVTSQVTEENKAH